MYALVLASCGREGHGTASRLMEDAPAHVLLYQVAISRCGVVHAAPGEYVRHSRDRFHIQRGFTPRRVRNETIGSYAQHVYTRSCVHTSQRY